MKRCPECRAENPEEALSCAACGAPLDLDEGTAGEATVPAEGTEGEATLPDEGAAPEPPPPPSLTAKPKKAAATGDEPAPEATGGEAEKDAGKPDRKVARDLVSDEAQEIYREDDLQFVPPKKSPFFWIGAIMAAAFGVMVIVVLSLWGSGAVDPDTCLLIYGFSAPLGIVGLALMTVKPSAKRTPVYIAVGKGAVLFYFMVVALAAFFSQTGHIKVTAMLQIFSFGLPALTLGAWLAIYNPHPADLPWYVCVAKALIGGGMHVVVAACLLFTADIVQWADIWQIVQGCAAAFGMGSLILVVDVFLTPHPTRG